MPLTHIRHALVVTAHLASGHELAEWLAADGYRSTIVAGFSAAREALDRCSPDLLVTELKLGAFNGLHLVLRARGRGLPAAAIVVGEADSVIEADAREMDARYVVLPVERSSFMQQTRLLIDHPGIAPA